MEMACPCRSGTSGTSSCRGDHLRSVSKRLNRCTEVHLRVAVGNDSVKANLVKIGCLELQHFVDASSVDLISSHSDFIRCTICTSKGSSDELLAVLVEQVVRRQMSTRRDLNQLGKAVSNLCLWQSSEKSEIEECLDRCMVSS